jgi:hypothetical protein
LPPPKLTVSFEPFVGFGKRRGYKAARPALSVAAAGDQPGALQNPQMLGDGGLAHAERPGELRDGSLAGSETGKNGAASGIGKSSEGGVQGGAGVSYITERLHNRKVMR